MTVLLVSEIPAQNNLPEDVVVNTLHFGITTVPPPGASLDLVAAAVTTFFASIYGGRISDAYLPGSAVIRMYDLLDPQPRVPIYEEAADYGAPSASVALPSEVALCLSFHGTFESGEPNARRRNRIYLGPFTEADNDSSTDNISRPSAGLLADIDDAASNLLIASGGSAAWQWDVYSPTEDASHAVVAGWVDNAWDTQRRRGRRPTARTLFP